MWVPALTEIADMTASLGGFIGLKDKHRFVSLLLNARMSAESHRIYAERHVVNPWSASMNHVPAGKLVNSDEILALADLKRTEFFDEVLRPQSMAHNAMVPLATKNDFRVGLNICRSE